MPVESLDELPVLLENLETITVALTLVLNVSLTNSSQQAGGLNLIPSLSQLRTEKTGGPNCIPQSLVIKWRILWERQIHHSKYTILEV